MLTPHHATHPPFEKFSYDALNSEQKLSAKTGRLGRSETGSGRSTGVDFEIYRSGRENPDRFHLCVLQSYFI